MLSNPSFLFSNWAKGCKNISQKCVPSKLKHSDTLRHVKNARQSRMYSSISVPKEATVLRYYVPGTPENVLKMEKETIPTSLKENEVLLKILAAPINPADLNMIEGVYPIRPKLPAVGGNEGVGLVVQTGSQIKNLKINDKVIPAKPGLGTWRDFGVFEENDLFKVPADIPTQYAATVSVNPCTALRLLDDFVQLKPGDVIIQNGGNSMVGTAVAQIAYLRDVKTISIIRGTRHDFATVVERLKHLGSYMVVSEEYACTAQFRRLLSDMEKPKLALNCVGGPSSTELARHLGDGGVMVTYGGMSHKPITIPTSQLIFKDIQLKGFWMSRWLEEHSLEERTKMLNTLFEMIRNNQLKLWMENWNMKRFFDALTKYKEQNRERKIVLVNE